MAAVGGTAEAGDQQNGGVPAKEDGHHDGEPATMTKAGAHTSIQPADSSGDPPISTYFEERIPIPESEKVINSA